MGELGDRTGPKVIIITIDMLWIAPTSGSSLRMYVVYVRCPVPSLYDVAKVALSSWGNQGHQLSLSQKLWRHTRRSRVLEDLCAARATLDDEENDEFLLPV